MAQNIPQSLTKSLVCLAFGATLTASGVALAQAPPSDHVDRRPLPPPSKETEPKEKPSPFRGSTLSWNHSATTETLGVGQDVQSENPTYEMSFGLAPRYYVWEDDGELPRTVSVGARLELIREFTNSDSTTQRGEWLFSNLSLAPQYSHGLYKAGGYETAIALRAPALTFPTSKASANNGTILGLGAALLGIQKFPVLGENSSVLKSFGLTGRVGYEHVFRRTTTPTNPELERERMGPDLETVPSDQLSGGAFTEREVVLGVSGNLVIHERVHWSNLFEWHLAWKYRFQEDTEVALPTGPAPVESQQNPDNFGVVSLFASEVGVTITKELEVEAGYQNLASQIGPDARRRNMFYSPDARFTLTLVGNLDALYDRVSGNERASVASSRAASGGNN